MIRALAVANRWICCIDGSTAEMELIHFELYAFPSGSFLPTYGFFNYFTGIDG